MELSFYLPEKYFPSNDWLQAWKEHRPLPLEKEGKIATLHCWIYQTWSLLAAAGIRASLVHELPKTGCVFALSGTLSTSFQARHHSPDLFLIDIVADGRPHPGAHVHLVQNQVHAHRLWNAHFMPHWPQVGLIPRQKNRTTLFERLAFFGDPTNLAADFLSTSWQGRLKKELSLELEIKDSSHWHDYSDVDAVLAIRDFSSARQLHKPATKLYNAWLAGVPFIGGNDSAYQAHGKSGVDYLVAKSPEQVLEHLHQLKENPHLRSHLVQNGLASGAHFTQQATLERWKNFIQLQLPTLVVQWENKSTNLQSAYYLAQRAMCWVDKYWRS